MNYLKRINLIILLSVILVFLSLNAAAYENFEASMKQSTALCSCSSKIEPIVITNTGDTASIYNIYVKDGGLSQWISIAPFNLALLPGQSKVIYENIAPACTLKNGKYKQIIEVVTAGVTKTYEQEIALQNCLNINIQPSVYEQTICPCETANFEFYLDNLGGYTEYYKLTTDSFGEQSIISENPVVLNPGERRKLSYFVKAPCDLTGSFVINVSAETQKSKQKAETSMYLNVGNCYDYSLNAGEVMGLSSGIQDFAENKNQKYQLCEAGKYFIPIEIDNPSKIKESYEIEVENKPLWVALSESTITVNPKSRGYVFLYAETSLKPEKSSKITVSTVSKIGKIIKEINLDLEPKNCYTPEIGKKENRIEVRYNNIATSIPIKNTGIKTTSYQATLEPAIDWMSLEENSFYLNPGETKNLRIITTPANETKQGTYVIRINLKADNGITYSKQFYFALIKENAYTKIKDFIKKYWVLALLLVIVIIVLILILTPRIKQEMENAKRRREKAKEKAETERVKNQIRSQVKKELKDEIKEIKGALKEQIAATEKIIKKDASKEAKKEAKPVKKEEKKEEAKEIKVKLEIWPLVLIIIIAIVAATLYYVFTTSQMPSGNATSTTLSFTTTLSSGGEGAGEPIKDMAIKAMMPVLIFAFIYRWYILSAAIILAILLAVLIIASMLKNKGLSKAKHVIKEGGKSEKVEKASAKKSADKIAYEKKQKKGERKEGKEAEGKALQYIGVALIIILVAAALTTVALSSLGIFPLISQENKTPETTTTFAASTTQPQGTSTTLKTTTTSTTASSTSTTLTSSSTSSSTSTTSYESTTSATNAATTNEKQNPALLSRLKNAAGSMIESIKDNAAKYKYQILFVIAVIILIILFFSMKKEKELEKKVAKDSDSIEKKPELMADLTILALIAGLLLIIYLIHREIGILNALKYFLNAGSSIFMLALGQSRYILGAIILLIILIIARHLIRKSRKKRETEASLNAYSPGDDAIIPINEKYGIGELSFRIRKKINDGRIILRRLRIQPTFIRASRDVYAYFEMKTENIETDSISSVLLRFRIKKCWIDNHRIIPKSVKLKRYENRQWQELPTKIIDADDNYVYYEIRLFEFSYYAITGERAKEKEDSLEFPDEPAIKKAEQKPSKERKTEKVIPEKISKADEDEEKKDALWPIYLLIILAIAIFATVAYYNYGSLEKMIIPAQPEKTTTTTLIAMTSLVTTTTSLSNTSITLAETYWSDDILDSIENGRYKYDLKGRVFDTKESITLDNDEFADLLISSKIEILEKTRLKLSDLDLLVGLLSPGKTLTEDGGIPLQIVQMNNQSTLNLSEYFSDPDGDPLEFNATLTRDISIMIDNNKGIAIITPKKDFWGHENVIFTADDRKGGIVESNNVTIIIKKAEAPKNASSIQEARASNSTLLSWLLGKIKDYLSYIIAGVILVIILIVILKFNESLFSFPEDKIQKIDEKGREGKEQGLHEGKEARKRKGRS